MPQAHLILRQITAVALCAAAIIAHAQQQPAPHDDPAVVFNRGIKALQSGALQEAEADFRTVTHQDPTSAAAFINLGVTLMREKRWTDALVPLQRAEKLDSSMAGIHLNLGLAHFEAGSYSEAVPEFRVTLDHAPQSSQARYLLGLSCFLSDDYGCATTTLLPLWPAQSNNLTYLYVLGSAAGKAKQPEVETNALRQMAEVGHGSPEFHLYAGKAMLGKQDYQGAVTELQQAISQQPTLPMAHFFLAEAYDAQHQEQQALDQLKLEITLEPNVAYSYDELGRVCALLGRNSEAIAAYQAAITRDPSLSSSYIGLANLYKQQQHPVQALEMMDHAVLLLPRSGQAHYLRAQLLHQLHRETEAKAEFASSATMLREVHDNLQHGSDATRNADAAQLRNGAQL